MNEISFFARLRVRIEMWLVGPLEVDVRRNMFVDVVRLLDHIDGIRSMQVIFVINAFVMLPYI